MLLEGMKILEARERINDLDSASYPTATAQSKKDIHRKLSKTAFPSRFAKTVSLDEAFSKVVSNGR